MTLVCKATGQPTPKVMWRKAFGYVTVKVNIVVAGWNMTILSVTKADGGVYSCSARNLLSEDSAVALVTVIDRLRFILAPPPDDCCKMEQRHNIKLCGPRQKRYSLGKTEPSTS